MSLLAMAPLIVKLSVSGFGPAEWKRSEKCEVFENKILVTRTYNEEEVHFEIPFDGADAVRQLTDGAMEERVKSDDNYMCDGPSTTISARFDRGLGKEILLYSTGGCGSPKRERLGPDSQALIDIASTFCPTTH